MKLVNLHGLKTHKACRVKHGTDQKWAPLCQPRVWESAGLFKGGIQVIDDFEGEESLIDCKRCLSKMGRSKPCPTDNPIISDKERKLRACRKRQLAVQRRVDLLQRERETLILEDRKLVQDLNQLDDTWYEGRKNGKPGPKDE